MSCCGNFVLFLLFFWGWSLSSYVTQFVPLVYRSLVWNFVHFVCVFVVFFVSVGNANLNAKWIVGKFMPSDDLSRMMDSWWFFRFVLWWLPSDLGSDECYYWKSCWKMVWFVVKMWFWWLNTIVDGISVCSVRDDYERGFTKMQIPAFWPVASWGFPRVRFAGSVIYFGFNVVVAVICFTLFFSIGIWRIM